MAEFSSNPEFENLYTTVGEMVVGDKHIALGVPASESRYGHEYTLLDSRNHFPLATKSMLYVFHAPFKNEEIGQKKALNSLFSATGEEISLDMEGPYLSVCTAIEMHIDTLIQDRKGLSYGWLLHIKNEVSDEILKELGLTRAQLYEGIEEHVNATHIVDPTKPNLSVLLENSQDLQEFQIAPKQPNFIGTSPLKAKIHLDEDVEERIRQAGTMLIDAINDLNEEFESETDDRRN